MSGLFCDVEQHFAVGLLTVHPERFMVRTGTYRSDLQVQQLSTFLGGDLHYT